MTKPLFLLLTVIYHVANAKIIMESRPVLVGQTAEISCNFQLGENEYLNTIAWT